MSVNVVMDLLPEAAKWWSGDHNGIIIVDDEDDRGGW
jgi:hypothetical protein